MTVKPIPDGYPAVIPYVMVADAKKFIAFMQGIFSAEPTEHLTGPNGAVAHAELRIGDSLIMLSEASEAQPATKVMLHFYVEDVDRVFERAIAAGATAISEPADQFYGDRSGGCIEPCGNTIWIATHIEDVSPDELQRRATAQAPHG